MSASRSAVVAYRSTVTLSGTGDLPAAPPAAAAVPAYVSLWASAARPVNARAIATSTHCRRLEWFIIVTPVDRSRGKYRRVTGVQRAGAPCSSEGPSVPGRPGPTENSAGSQAIDADARRRATHQRRTVRVDQTGMPIE